MNKALRVTAVYLILAGIIGTVFPILIQAPAYSEFEARTLMYQLGAYSRELSISLAFLISGIGLLKSKLWARKLGLVALSLAFFYGGNAFAWGWAGGKPTTNILIYSYCISFFWYGIWFFILYMNSANTLNRPKLSER